MDHHEGPNKKIEGTPQHEAPELEQSKEQMNQNEGKVGHMDRPEGPGQQFKGAPRHEDPETDQSKKQMNQPEGMVSHMDRPKGPEQQFKGTPRHEAPETDQSKKQMNQPEGKVGHMDRPEGPEQQFKGAPRHEAPETDQSKKQMNQPEGMVDYMDHPNTDQEIKSEPQHEAQKLDQFEKQKNQIEGKDECIDHPEGPNQKFKGIPQHETSESDQSNKRMNRSDSKDILKDAPQNEVTEPDQSKKQINQPKDEVDYMNPPEDPDHKSKDAPLHETSNIDESEKLINQSEPGSTPEPAIKSADDKGTQSLKNTDQEVPPELGAQKVATEAEDKINGTGLESTSKNIPGNNKKSEDSSSLLAAPSQDQGKGEIAPKKKHFWSNWPVIGDAPKASIPKQPRTDPSKESDLTAASEQPETDTPDEKQQEHIEVKVDEADTEPAEEVVPAETSSLVTPSESTVAASSKTLEILKSVVYGGLIELLTSLSVVTSAASADATTLNIVALSMANLIGGLFVLGHNLEELKSEQVDRYIEILGQKENFILHAFIAIISFLAFGLVPPVVYGFSFGENGDKDFKLAAVAAASLLCIILLSIAKAYIKSANSYLTYLKTVLYYVSTGAVASLLSYIAGDLVKKLIEKLGWFETASNFALRIPGIDLQQPGWGSY